MHLCVMRRLCCCLALLAGCDAWSLSINGDGFIHITITGGDPYRPRDGYRIRVTRGEDSYIAVLPESGELHLEDYAGERLTVSLVPPAGCVVSPATDPVALDAGGAGRATFALACAPARR